MNDINFFSIYSNKNSAAYKRKRLIELGIIILAAVVVLYAGLFAWLVYMESKTQEINEYLMTPKVQKAIAEYNIANDSLTATKEYNAAAASLIGSMEKLNNLTTEKLNIISKSLPNTARIEAVEYSNGIFSCIIYVPSMQVAAQTVVRLEETEIFDDVVLHGATINKERTGYLCSIVAMMKVGDE